MIERMIIAAGLRLPVGQQSFWRRISFRACARAAIAASAHSLCLALALFGGNAVAVPIVIDYVGAGWTDDARTAGNAAASVWSRLTGQRSFAGENVSVQAKINAGGLARTEPSLIINFMNEDPDGINPYVEDFWYPTSLASHLARKDLAGANPDMVISFGNAGRFHFGLDHRQHGLKYDFYTVMLHELAHGLGFNSLFVEDGDYEPLGGQPNHSPSIYDGFLEAPHPDGQSRSIVYLDQEDRANAIVGEQVFWGGDYAAALIGLRAPEGSVPGIYSPVDFDNSASLSHLDPDRHLKVLRPLLMGPNYVGPRLGPGFAEFGMLLDMGWLYPARSVKGFARLVLPEPPTAWLMVAASAALCLVRLNRTRRS